MSTISPGLDPDTFRRLYFIGIGGIGMSALARYFNRKGAAVFGYDRTRSALCRQLEQEGMEIHYAIDPGHIPDDLDIVVYTPAIPADQPEVLEVKRRGLPMLKRAELLGMLSRQKRSVAIAGTHGKTSTSVLLSHILHASGTPVTAFLGGIAVNYDSNFLGGDADWVVLEADEYDRSFLQLFPDIAVINSLDADHLDVYGDRRSLLEHYFRFALQIRPGGMLYVTPQVYGAIDREVIDALERRQIQIQTFGLEEGDHKSRIISQGGGKVVFDMESDGHRLRGLELIMPGVHNVINATVAIAIALKMGVGTEAVRKNLEGFRGIRRRFEYLLRTDAHTVIDDYAHHPTELKAAIATARAQFEGQEITVVFQPHLYTRTRDFAAEFAEALEGADIVILVEIYPAREEPIEGVSSEMLFNRIKKEEGKKILSTKSELMHVLKRLNPKILLTLGAGDLDEMLPEVLEIFK